MKQIVRNTLMVLSMMSIMQVMADPVDLAGADMNVEDAAGFAELPDGVTNSSGGEPVTLTFDISSDMEYAGKISGNIKLVKKGVGMLTLSGDNGYTGGTVIGGYDGSTYMVGGRLRANSLTAFGAASGAITVNSNCQQSNMDSNKVTCVVFNVAGGTFAYPINTSVWPNPSAGPSGETGKRQYNVAVTADEITLSGRITGGSLSVHCGGLKWDTNPDMVADTGNKNIKIKISGDIYFPSGTCHFGIRGGTIDLSGRVTTLGVYQTNGSNWSPEWALSNPQNAIGIIDVGGGLTSPDRSLTASGENALGGAMVYSRSDIAKSRSVKISANQTVESFSMNPNGSYVGGSLAASDSRHYIYATKTATVTMLGTNNRTNDWFMKDGGANKAMSLVWNPTGNYTYTCVGHTNTINGTITVSGGTFEVGDSCTFSNVTAISVAEGATLKVSSADIPFSTSVAIEAESGATLDLSGDITVATVKVGENYLSAKGFSCGSYKGLNIIGAGKLYVTSNPEGEQTYTWIGGSENDSFTTAGNWLNSAVPDFDAEAPFVIFAGGTSTVLDRDVDVSGVVFDGVTEFNLSASENHVLSLGEGGISNAPAASARAVTVSAPVMPKVDQVWQMETNTSFSLSGVLKRYGITTPTITVRQGSYADPTINFIGSATPEGASDFAGDIVFEETDLPDSGLYGNAHVRASGYEPFGPGGTLKLRGAGEGHYDKKNRVATLFLSNAVISKAVEFGEYYAACYCAEDNTTNVINGAFAPFKLHTSSGTFPPEFMVGTNAVLRLCGDIDFGTRNNSDTADVTLSSSASSSSVRAHVPTGKIVFDGRITRMPRRMKRVNPIGLEFNAADNAITNLYLRANDANDDKASSVVKFGTSYALSNGQAKVTFPKRDTNGKDSRPVNFDLNGTVQHILGFVANMCPATHISSSAGHGTLRISQSSDVVFEGYVATNVTLQMEGAATLTFSHSKAFKAGSTLVVSNGTVAVSNASALNEDVTLKLLGGKISIPVGQTALVGEAYYLDGNGELKPLKKGTYGPNNSTVGSFFAPGSGSVRVKKGEGYGFVFSIY